MNEEFRVRTPEATRNKVLAYSSVEEHYATNITERSESYERGPEQCSGTKFYRSSNLLKPTNRLARSSMVDAPHF